MVPAGDSKAAVAPPITSTSGPLGVSSTTESPTRAPKFTRKFADTIAASPPATRFHTAVICCRASGQRPSPASAK